MPPIDSKKIDSAQMLYGSFIKNGLEKRISQLSATKFSFFNKQVKTKSKIEEDSFSGDLKSNGRTSGFIGKEFKKYFDIIHTKLKKLFVNELIDEFRNDVRKLINNYQLLI